MLSPDIRNHIVKLFGAADGLNDYLADYFDKHHKAFDGVVPFYEDRPEKAYKFDASSAMSWLKAAAHCGMPYLPISKPTAVTDLNDPAEMKLAGENCYAIARVRPIFIRSDTCIPETSIKDLAKNTKFAGLRRRLAGKPTKIPLTKDLKSMSAITHDSLNWFFCQARYPGMTFHSIRVVNGEVDAETPPAFRNFALDFVESLAKNEIRPVHPMMSEFGLTDTYVLTIAAVRPDPSKDTVQLYLVDGRLLITDEDRELTKRRIEEELSHVVCED